MACWKERSLFDADTLLLQVSFACIPFLPLPRSRRRSSQAKSHCSMSCRCMPSILTIMIKGMYVYILKLSLFNITMDKLIDIRCLFIVTIRVDAICGYIGGTWRSWWCNGGWCCRESIDACRGAVFDEPFTSPYKDMVLEWAIPTTLFKDALTDPIVFFSVQMIRRR